MWIVAGILLGVVVAGSLIGFHSGPHTHVVAGVVGILAAAWLALMASEGRSATLVWLLFVADLVVSTAIGVMGWTAIRRSSGLAGRTSSRPLEGAEGVAVTDLTPDGVVRVRGEQWSATCVNGTLRAGSSVQVLHGGVRLEVWGEHPHDLALGPLDDKAEVGDAPRKEQGS